MGWSNAEFDALLAEANAIADADKRRAVAGKCQALIAEEGCTIQPYWRSIFRHKRKSLVGQSDMHPTFENRFQYMGFNA